MSDSNFHLHFTSRSQTFDIDFQLQETPASESVCINGRNYTLQGDTFKIAWLRAKIPSLSNVENISLDDLQLRLQALGATDVSVTGKVDTLVRAHFSPPEIDVTAAREAYLFATEDPLESHAEVGILHADGSTTVFSLGKDEAYGAHRVGSVTKTFTAFLAMKLVNDGVIRLDTKCGDLINDALLEKLFIDLEAAKKMSLEQLLSHTAHLQYSDEQRDDDPDAKSSLLQNRFLYQDELKTKYKHQDRPQGMEDPYPYSNLGFDIAAWMMEIAYNRAKGHETPVIPFSQIMRDELFTKVFGLSEDTRISPGPSGHGDVIQAGCGDMVSSVNDLLRAGQTLQQGEEHLVPHFGEGWQSKMLAARDTAEEYGLGCLANASSIQFSGLNFEIFEDGRGRDVTAHIAFPLRRGQVGLV